MITACQTKSDFRRFEEAPEDLHRSDPAFVPPFPGSIVKYLSPDSAFNRRHGEILPFLATQNGLTVGRIAAIINRTHNERYGDRTGFFGFFDCADDPVVARALFAAAENALRQRGCDHVRGPYNPSINDECGLLTQGHHLPTFMGLPWNPAYYAPLVLKAGYASARTLYGYALPLHRLEPPPRLEKIVARTAKRSRLRLRPIDLKNLQRELEIVHEVYNSTLERNWGFVPITMDDLLSAADDLRAIADPAMILIAEMDGENAGVALSLPNFNELLALTRTTPRWLRLLHIAWLMKTRRIRSARQVIYGISPRFRDRGGLHAWLLYEQFVCAKARFHDAELGWIEETNTEIMQNSLLVGATQHRTWEIYERPLG